MPHPLNGRKLIINQQAIRQVMLENQLILDNIDVPIWLFNADNVLIRTNTAVSRVAGRPGETISTAENDRIFREFSANISEPDVSTEVRNSAQEMIEGNKLIFRNIADLQDSSTVMKSSMDEMSIGARKINESGSELSQISEQMKDSIADIAGQIDQFTV